MANQTRLRQNVLSGTLTDNPLTNNATTANSANFAALPVVSATQHMVLVFDPLGAGNGPEIVYVTAHTASATSATIVRGREGTSGVQHASTTPWVHAPVVSDYVTDCTAATHPSNPYQGQLTYETDTDKLLAYNGTAWIVLAGGTQPNYQASAYATAQSALAGTAATTIIVLGAVDYDYNSNFNTSNHNYTAPLAGIYQIDARFEVQYTDTTAQRQFLTVYKNAAELFRGADITVRGTAMNANDVIALTASRRVALAASDVIDLRIFTSTSGGGTINVGTQGSGFAYLTIGKV